jgi:transcriptional regulator NrdR family protein
MGLNEMFKKIASIESEKMELGKHEIELNAIQDFLNAQDAAQEMLSNAQNNVLEIRKAFDPILRQLDMAKNAHLRAIKVGEATMKQVKDLGLELPPKFDSAYDRLLKDAKTTEDSIKKVNKLKTEIFL